MIRKLSIRNYALIDALDIDFYSGFSVVTGETGAGKSIILGALSLLLGQRADSKAGRQRRLSKASSIFLPIHYDRFLNIMIWNMILKIVF